jgi:hypothetical protein
LAGSSLGYAAKLTGTGMSQMSRSNQRKVKLTRSSLAALHLDVLQNLLLASALPDGLLRATGPDIASLVAPHAGLQTVIKSSGFDFDAVKHKLETLGVATATCESP